MLAPVAHRVHFFVVGMQKGGTTALDGLLRGHPDIRMARVKEPHFFDNESIDWSAPDYNAYHAMFDLRDEQPKMVGEATPISSYWPHALERIAAYNPNPKMIICLRHPTCRAHSHWRMEAARASDDLPFADAIREPGRSRMPKDGAHRVFSYVERGFYSRQVLRIRSIFPNNSVMFLRTDRLWRDPDAALSDICAFLGVATYPRQIGKSTYRVPIQTRGLGKMCPGDRRYLDALFADDIRLTSSLTGLDLTDWVDPAYAEPME
jgi:hypothetical protein